MLIAPLSANTLAKLANGICDNLLVRTQNLPLPHDHHRTPLLNLFRLAFATTAPPPRSTQTSLLRALPAFVPVWVFPAMNTHMYSHPFTAKQLKIVKDELGYQVHGPVEKLLACGDLGEQLVLTACGPRARLSSKALGAAGN